MSILNEVFREEYERISRVIDLINKELDSLPKGYISMKKINGNRYFYLQERKGKRIVSQYLGPKEPKDFMKKMERKKELEVSKKSLLQDREKLKKIVGDDE